MYDAHESYVIGGGAQLLQRYRNSSKRYTRRGNHLLRKAQDGRYIHGVTCQFYLDYDDRLGTGKVVNAHVLGE